MITLPSPVGCLKSKLKIEAACSTESQGNVGSKRFSLEKKNLDTTFFCGHTDIVYFRCNFLMCVTLKSFPFTYILCILKTFAFLYLNLIFNLKT